MTDDTENGNGEYPPHVISLEEAKRQRDEARAEKVAPDEVIAGLGQLDPIAYDQRRLKEAQRLGVRVTTLDSQVRRYRIEHGLVETDPQPETGLVFTEVEPWPDPVDGDALLDQLVAAFRRYLALPDGAAEALSLWAINTHAHDCSDVSPRMALESPEPGCGKSTCLTILSRLVPRPLPASNISPAAVFRAVDTMRPTLLVDELDSFIDGYEELRGILNSGHHRDTAFVIRVEGDNHAVRTFSTWSPMAMASIRKLPATLEARSIVVQMRRKRHDQEVVRFRSGRVGHLEALLRQAVRWAADNSDKLTDADPDVPDALQNRVADNWRPLLAIADAAGGDWPNRAREVALCLSGIEAGEDPSVGIQLLADLRQMFAEQCVDRLASAAICADLANMEDRPWPEWKAGKPITQRQLAALVGPFKVRPKAIRLDDGTTPRGYLRAWFDDPFARYLPPPSATPQQVNETAPFGDISAATADAAVADKKGLEPA